MKKISVLMLCVFFIFGSVAFAGPVRACEGNNCMPTTVVNQGGSYNLQGKSIGIGGGAVIGFDCNYCGPSFGFLDVGLVGVLGHGQIGGTHTFMSVTPGKTHGFAVNGNTYTQGYTTGKKAVAESGAWVNDVNMKEGYNYFRNIDKVTGNKCFTNYKTKTVTEGFKSYRIGTDIGAVASGKVKGPGSYQSQAGVNYTKIKW